MKFKIILIPLFVFTVGIVITHAQTPPTPAEVPFNFDKAYKDFVFVSDQYTRAHSDYLLAKAQYLDAQTLASQTKAKDATSTMLVARDNVLVTYLLALRQKLVESEGVDSSILNGLTNRLDTDVSWWRNHMGKIGSAGSLADLTADSTEALKHYPNTEAISYESLATIPLGKEQTLRNSLNSILSDTKGKIAQIRTNGDLDTVNAERWVLETDQKLTRSLDKEIEAQKFIPSLQATTVTNNQNKESIYNNFIQSIEDSVQFLKDASSYMKEVLKAITTKQ